MGDTDAMKRLRRLMSERLDDCDPLSIAIWKVLGELRADLARARQERDESSAMLQDVLLRAARNYRRLYPADYTGDCDNPKDVRREQLFDAIDALGPDGEKP